MFFWFRRYIYSPVILPGVDNLHGCIDEHAYIHVEIIVPVDNNFTKNFNQKNELFIKRHLPLRHLPEKLSKPHFSEITAPEENPLPGKTSLAGHIRMFFGFVAIYIVTLFSPGRIIYMAVLTNMHTFM